MILQADGVLHDTQRRDTLIAGDGSDLFILAHDGRTDSIVGLQDGVDRIDLSSWDATWGALTIRPLSGTEYVVTYQGEERLRITFATPEPEAVPASGWLLDDTDFVFRAGLPAATVQIIMENHADIPEVIYGTTRPDIFVFDPDGMRDTIRLFEPGKDLIDLANYGTSFGALDFIDRKPGRVVVKIPFGEAVDRLVVIDAARQMTADDFTADMFLF